MTKRDRLSVLLLNAPFLKRYSRGQRNPGVTRSDTMYYPYWMSYAAGAVEQAGFNTKFIDAPGDGWDYDEVEKKIVEFNPGLFILDTTTPSIHNDIVVLDKLKTKFPQVKFCMVGTHATGMVDETFSLAPNLDCIARGEYDYTVRDLALAVENGTPWSEIQGLSYRENGELKHNPDRPLIEDLDELPFVSDVYKRHLNIYNYFNPDCLYPNVTLLSGRGCPYKCSFCLFVHTLSGGKVRYRSVDNVLEEMVHIQKIHPAAKAFFFEDDLFTLNEKRCVELCEGMIKRGVKLQWNANARAKLSYETMKVMKKAGCHALCVGFESGNQDILDAYGKKITLEDYLQFAKNAHRAGIKFHGAFIVGGPGENKEKMMNTLNMAIKIKPDTAQFYPLMVYPGTPEYQRMQDLGLLITTDYNKWLTKDGLHNCIIRTEDSSPEDLIRFCDFARRKFYLRPSYIAYKAWQGLFDFQEMRRTTKAFKVFVKHLYKPSI